MVVRAGTPLDTSTLEIAMSLRPAPPFQIPEQTARIARAAFRRPTLAMQIADSLGAIFADQQFADLFPAVGQPALSPARLALVTLLQYAEDLTDRAAADAVRSRIDWKYLLGLELEDAGFDHTALHDFRVRLIAGGAEAQLLETVLEACRSKGWIKARGRQRTDSTHVLGAIRALNRLELVVETMHAALNALATAAPEWLRAAARPEWVDRYSRRGDEFRLPQRPNEREAFIEQVGVDGYALLDAVCAPESPEWLRHVEAVEVLRRVWIEQYQLVDGRARWRGPDDQPPSSRLITSPYDVEARFATKRGASWRGYKVHLTETCDDETPHLITHVETAEAAASDLVALDTIHEGLERKGVLPATHLVDSGYIEAEQLGQSQTRYGVDLVGPPRPDTGWQARAGQGFEAARFAIDWDTQEARCPSGKTSSTWHEGKDGRGADVIRINFASSVCGVCPAREQCTTSKIKRRQLTIRPREQYEQLERARAREQTEEYKKQYNVRAGVEGTISQGVRAFGLRRARYVGAAKVGLQHVLTAAGMNLVRIADWLAEQGPAKPRRSSFARVMAAVAA
jgi:transposase